MEAVWLLWPNMNHKQGLQNSGVTLQLINAIAPFAKVKLVVPNDSVFTYVRHQLPDSLTNTTRLEVLTIPYQEFWARDMGPLFTKQADGSLQIADFNFNAWSYGNPSDAVIEKDEKLDEHIAQKLGIPFRSSPMIHEGGDHEINSKGTLICVESVEMMRNPGMTKPKMEAEFGRLLGAKKVIWLKKGVYEDDNTQNGTIVDQHGKSFYTLLTTNGHIDEFCRWVNDSTVLLAQVQASELKNPIDRENYRRMEENFNILRQAKDQDGKPIQIIRMPTPSLVYSTMQPHDPVYDIISEMSFRDKTKFPKEKTINVIAAASYLNFLIVNDLVIAQKYWRRGMGFETQIQDNAAMATLQKVFPNKKILMIDALPINFGGGGVHCITMNQPQ
jgi:agmatine deiminase